MKNPICLLFLLLPYALFAQTHPWYEGFMLDLTNQKIEGQLFFNEFDHLLSFKNERLNIKYSAQEINGFGFFDTQKNTWVNYYSLTCNKHINQYEQADFLELKFEGKKIKAFYRQDVEMLNNFRRRSYITPIRWSNRPTIFIRSSGIGPSTISTLSERIGLGKVDDPRHLSPFLGNNVQVAYTRYRPQNQKGVYFINTQGQVVRANKKTIQALVGNKKKVLKKFVRTKLLQYHSTTDVIKILTFCDTLLDEPK